MAIGYAYFNFASTLSPIIYHASKRTADSDEPALELKNIPRSLLYHIRKPWAKSSMKSLTDLKTEVWY